MKKLLVLTMTLAIIASTMFTSVAFAAAVNETDSDSVYLWDAFYESDALRNELYDENVRYIKVDPTKANSGNNSVKMHREATHSATTLKLQKNSDATSFQASTMPLPTVTGQSTVTEKR